MITSASHSGHNRSYSRRRGRTFYSDCGDPPTSQQRASGGILSSTANQPHMHCSQNLLWPSKQQLTDNLLPYWKVRGELSLYENLLLYGSRIVVPTNLRNETLHKIHQGHQGIQRCRLRIASSVWWPGVSKAIESYVKNCPQCLKSYTPPKEPLLSSPLPNRPWQKVAVDLFELNKSHYLLVVDYFSRFPEFFQLSSTTSPSIVRVLKATFARHGVPSILFTDNEPQFSSQDLKEFASAYSFRHITSSP